MRDVAYREVTVHAWRTGERGVELDFTDGLVVDVPRTLLRFLRHIPLKTGLPLVLKCIHGETDPELFGSGTVATIYPGHLRPADSL